MGKSKRKVGKVAAMETPLRNSGASMHFGVEAARWTGNRALVVWPSVDALSERDAWTLEACWRKGRALYHNSPSVRMAVRAVCTLTGVLMPRPMSGDEEWNRLARDAFLAYVQDPARFDVSGRLNWRSAQVWLERMALIDGDALSVMAVDGDEARVGFYAAPQVWSAATGTQAWAPGCVMDERTGRVTEYHLRRVVPGRGGDLKEDFVRVPADACVMYTHEPDPVAPRTLSELVACITTAEDLHEIDSYNKAGIKAAAAFGIYETKALEDRNPGGDALGGAGSKRRDVAAAEAAAAAAALPPEPALEISGVRAVSLAPGRELKTIHDNRPSNETRAFTHDLRGYIALGLGLHPEVLYYTSELGGASIRYVMQVTKDWRADRLEIRQVWCNKVWQHVVGMQVAAGRLRPCDTRDWRNVQWINRSDMTIDKGRDTAAMINLVREGLADANEWTLATCGKTVEEIAQQRLHDIAHVREMAAAAGVPMEWLWPGSIGATTGGVASGGEVPDAPGDGEPEVAAGGGD